MTDTNTKIITTFEDFESYIGEKTYIDWESLSSDCEYTNTKIITLDVIKKTANDSKYGWNWGVISCRSDVTEDFVLENIDLPWDWIVLYANPNISLGFVERNPKHRDEYFYGMSDNPNMTLEFLLAHPSKHWLFDGSVVAYCSDWSWKYYHTGLSRNKSFDISWYHAMPDKRWRIPDFVFADKFSVNWIDELPGAEWCLNYQMLLKSPVPFIINCLDTGRFLGDRQMVCLLEDLSDAFRKRTKEDCVEMLKWVIPRVLTHYNKITFGYIFEMIYTHTKDGNSVLEPLMEKHFTKEERDELKKYFW
jgi:hypothetical protein